MGIGKYDFTQIMVISSQLFLQTGKEDKKYTLSSCIYHRYNSVITDFTSNFFKTIFTLKYIHTLCFI